MAHRSRVAERIIREAFGVSRPDRNRRPVRYELLGGTVAVAVLRDERAGGQLCIRVARRLADGRAVQMRKASRIGFASIQELLAYFDDIYAQYGKPNE